MKNERMSIYDEKGACLGFVPPDDLIVKALVEMGFTLKSAQICPTCGGCCPTCKGAGYVSGHTVAPDGTIRTMGKSGCTGKGGE